jgi:hypothetical protein
MAKDVKEAAARPIVVFGLNTIERPVAATFTEAETTAAANMAKQLKLRLVKLTKPAALELFRKLPAGIAGAKRIPIVASDLFSAVLAAADGEDSAPKRPISWDKIGVGSIVLAQESFDDGWWEAIVLEVKKDMLTLAWRDYPRQPNVTRDRAAVALLYPSLP